MHLEPPTAKCTIANTLDAPLVTAAHDEEAASIEVLEEGDERFGTVGVDSHFVLAGTNGGTTGLKRRESPSGRVSSTNQTYTLTETVPSGWEVKSINCAPNSDMTYDAANSATIKLVHGGSDDAHPPPKVHVHEQSGAVCNVHGGEGLRSQQFGKRVGEIDVYDGLAGHVTAGRLGGHPTEVHGERVSEGRVVYCDRSVSARRLYELGVVHGDGVNGWELHDHGTHAQHRGSSRCARTRASDSSANVPI